MYVRVAGFHSQSLIAVLLCAALCAACGSEAPTVTLMKGPDGGLGAEDADDPNCNAVEVDGDSLVVQVDEVTARFTIGAPYDKTVMLFGGEPATVDNSVSNVYIIGLNKEDALQLAMTYPDFHLCDSLGGMEATKHIVDYDLVPATCEVYEQITRALDQFHINNARGADRVSLRFEGAPLSLQSVVFDDTGEDVTDQLAGRNFHMVTSVEQLTGQSVLSFGTTQ